MMCFIIALLFLSLVVSCSGDLPCNKVKKDHGYVCLCNGTYCDTISPPNKLLDGQFHFYYTSEDSPGFNHETGHFRMQSFSPYGFKYEVNKTKKFQKIRGFGGAFTDSFGVNLNTLSEDTQENLLRSFFAEDGIEYTVCRIVIGSCDFSVRDYTYLPNYDPTLSTFNLTEDDYIYKIAHIKKAINISKKHIRFLGSAWMSPAWTKVRNTSSTGFIKTQFRQLWADYHVKTLDAYKSEGIKFWALTTGNEPITLFADKAMSVVAMFPEGQRDWVINNLGPALKKANYSTQIYVLDDMRIHANWWMDTIMRDKRSEKFVSGISLHFYMDTISPVDILDTLHEKYPNQEIIYTESSINVVLMKFLTEGDSITGKNEEGPHLGSWKTAAIYAMNIIENLNHWTTTYIDWNLALNELGGPNLIGFPCDASIIINDTKNEFYKQSIFYIMGHFSKFIHPDAVIIQVRLMSKTGNSYGFTSETSSESTSSTKSSAHKFRLPPFSDDVQYIGALNPDDSITIIFYNPKSSPVQIQFYDPDRGQAFLILDPKSLNTLLYW